MGPKREAMRDVGLLWLRVLLGIGIATHGYGKLFGGHMADFQAGVEKLGLPFGSPEVLAHLAAWSEFAGGIFLAMGLGTRIAALLIFGTMTVAAFVRHADDAFGVKELALCYWTMAGTLVLTGPGRISLDALLEDAFRRGRK